MKCKNHPYSVNVDIVAYSSQTVHAVVSFNNMGDWFLSPLDASPIFNKKKCLWEDLVNISNMSKMPWLVAGNFNDVSSASEKKGGPFNQYKANIFNNRINDCKLIDLGWRGSPFTLVGKRRGGILVKERLDRALANDKWCTRFSNVMVSHLPRIMSDHHPILVDPDC